jgi:hypothetical protein
LDLIGGRPLWDAELIADRAPLSGRAGERPALTAGTALLLAASEGGRQRSADAIRARSDVRAADVQEKPTKRVTVEKIREGVVSSGSTKTAALQRTSQRAERE